MNGQGVKGPTFTCEEGTRVELRDKASGELLGIVELATNGEGRRKLKVRAPWWIRIERVGGGTPWWAPPGMRGRGR